MNLNAWTIWKRSLVNGVVQSRRAGICPQRPFLGVLAQFEGLEVVGDSIRTKTPYVPSFGTYIDTSTKRNQKGRPERRSFLLVWDCKNKGLSMS